MTRFYLKGGSIALESSPGTLAPRQENQLAFWGFEFDGHAEWKSSDSNSQLALAAKVLRFFEKQGIEYNLSDEVQALIAEQNRSEDEIRLAKAQGAAFKQGEIDSDERRTLLEYLSSHVDRRLKDHQLKAALHLLSVKNGANFSVPGSGKTTVVLSVFGLLRQIGELDALFVVGPPSCFGPWKTEYMSVFRSAPEVQLFAGGDVVDRRGRYAVNPETVADLNLTSFHTLLNDWERVKTLFQHQGIKFFLVIDEAHYIKQLGGAWADAVIQIAPYATRRCVLSGTPFPRAYSDAFNLFDTLWPSSPPITETQKHRIEYLTQRNELPEASAELDQAVAPLFYRVRKTELNLAAQEFHEPIVVCMNEHEKKVYDLIIDRVRELSQEEYFRDIDLVLRLRKGRMMRLRQCTSYISLLKNTLEDYNEDLIAADLPLADTVFHYDELEKPAKLEALLALAKQLLEKGEKLLVWSNFIETLKLIRRSFDQIGIPAELIYGATPVQSESLDTEFTRERIVARFNDPENPLRVLIANPAACSESISLHKACSQSVYYDMSYNCAQYLQSLDRIHRVGGSETRESHYYFLQYENTLDQDIKSNVLGKARRMAEIIDQDYPIYSLDMWSDDDELEAYERLFGKK